ncbi:MAG: NUDIX domain-containing protein [Mariprofundaceae bacterium]|nr:NUDIX domain-containing protein [Mariprofundaceae bacterium]
MKEMKMRYKIKEQRPLHRGFFRLDAFTVEHDRFDGGKQTIVREHLERGDAVAVLLYDPVKDTVLFIEQFRIGPAVRGDVEEKDAWLIEIVAGMIDEDEDPEACARRECVEEAGYAPKTLQPLGNYYSTPGGSSERIYLYLGEVDADKPCGSGGGLDEEHEDICTRWVSRKQAMQWVHQGRINSAPPLLALLLAFSATDLKR